MGSDFGVDLLVYWIYYDCVFYLVGGSVLDCKGVVMIMIELCFLLLEDLVDNV